MTCKDCIHYDVCLLGACINGGTGTCLNFKDKSRFIELPCKVGDKLYKIAPDFEKQRGSLKIQEYTVTDIIGNALITRPYTVFKVDRIGADVFIAREEAEKALERSKDNA